MPKEQIPIGIMVNSKNIESIKIKLDEDLELVDFWNLEFDEIKDLLKSIDPEGYYTIEKKNCITSSLLDSIYFGLELKFIKLPEDLANQRYLEVVVINRSKIIDSRKFLIQIFRPKIKLLDNTKKIILEESNTLIDFFVIMQYSGFGDVKPEIKVKTHLGQLISKSYSVEESLIREMYNLGYFQSKSNDDKLDEKDISGARLVDFEETLKRVSKKIGEIAVGNKFKDENEELMKITINKWIANIPSSEFLKRLGVMLANVMNEITSTNPTDRISLRETYATIPNDLETPLNKLIYEFTYKDLLGNVYEPIEFAVDVQDNRRNKTGMVKFLVKNPKFEDKDLIMNIRGI